MWARSGRWFDATLLLTLSACSPSPPAADLVFRNGPIYTVSSPTLWADALAVRGERIVAVGAESLVDPYVGSSTRVIDLDGRLLLPGFHDAHLHFLRGALSLDELDLSEARSIEDVQEMLRAFTTARIGDEWILGRGWNDRHFGERPPTRHQLDAVVGDRPVLLSSYDGQRVWPNTRALELAGIEEGYDIATVMEAVPKPTREETLEALRRAITYTQRFGITSATNLAGTADLLDVHLETRGEPGIRLHHVAAVDPETGDDELQRLHESGVGSVRISLDSTIGMRGQRAYEQAELDALVARLQAQGFQILIHAAGDRAVRMALDAYERVDDEKAGQRRHRIEHVELVDDEDIPRFASLGVLAGMQPYHASPGFGRGPARFAWRSLTEAGARLVHGSDWPATSIDPLVGIFTAVTRQDLDNRPEGGWIPSERLTVEQAVYGYTLAGAYASFQETETGSLEVGKLADLAVLSHDIFRMVPERIAGAQVEMTVVGGAVVYVAPSFLTAEERALLLAH